MRTTPLLAMLAAASAAFAGPDWTEVPDAGKLLPGQAIPFSPVESITGELIGTDAFGGPDVVDLFSLTTTVPNTKVRTGALLAGREANFDTVLFVFNAAGQGVVANDDAGPGDTSSVVTIPTPGNYKLAVAAKGVQPVSAAGEMFEIYAPHNQFAQVTPRSPGGFSPLQDWIGAAVDPEPRFYTARLSHEIPTLSEAGLVLLGLGFVIGAGYFLRRGL